MRIRGGGSDLLGAGIGGGSIRDRPSMNLPSQRSASSGHFGGGRISGVQLHPTSLPGGRLGREAHAFVDWLAEGGQSWWQMLPLGPPDRYGSPYKSASAFAAWPGLLAEPRAPVSREQELSFREREAYWIEDWARLAPGSVDQRAHPELFLDGAVAGTPPDAYTDKGQLWGNPLYDWPALRRRGYRWWVERFRRVFELYDVARIDHFRGFVAYWAVPAGARHALAGRWRRGPGRAPLGGAP